MSECWCGSQVDETGKHLTIPEGNDPWHGTHFRLADGKIEHFKEIDRG